MGCLHLVHARRANLARLSHVDRIGAVARQRRLFYDHIARDPAHKCLRPLRKCGALCWPLR